MKKAEFFMIGIAIIVLLKVALICTVPVVAPFNDFFFVFFSFPATGFLRTIIPSI